MFDVLLQQKQIQEEFMLILGGFQGFQGPWGVLTSIFLGCPFPSGRWVSWLVLFACSNLTINYTNHTTNTLTCCMLNQCLDLHAIRLNKILDLHYIRLHLRHWFKHTICLCLMRANLIHSVIYLSYEQVPFEYDDDKCFYFK